MWRARSDRMPTIHVRVELSELEGGRTRMRMTSAFGTLQEMERLLEMGMEEGMIQALGQTDALLS